MIPNGPFAIIRRAGRAAVEVFTGDVVTPSTRSPTSRCRTGRPGHARSPLVPYRQIAERGFACVDDGAPLECLRIDRPRPASRSTTCWRRCRTAARALHRRRLRHRRRRSTPRSSPRVLRDEIGRGEGANFVIHRVFEATVDGDPLRRRAGRASRRLLLGERGAYWTFLRAHRRPHAGRRDAGAARQRRRRPGHDEPDQRHVPAPGRPDRADLLRLPRRPEGDRRALHGARRGAEDDGRGRRAAAGRWSGRTSRRCRT